MTLILDTPLRIGIQTIHRRTEPAGGPWLPLIGDLVDLVKLVDDSGYDSLWVGDPISFPRAIFDPLLQSAQAAIGIARRVGRRRRAKSDSIPTAVDPSFMDQHQERLV